MYVHEYSYQPITKYIGRFSKRYRNKLIGLIEIVYSTHILELGSLCHFPKWPLDPLDGIVVVAARLLFDL